MDVTSRLLRVFQVDRQLAGLQSRLKTAERFLAEQTRLIAELDSKRQALAAQIRQITASTANQETEMRSLDERAEQLREQMNLARTNKEYKTFLTEVNTVKTERSRVEDDSLAQMAKADELKAQLAALETSRAERDKVRAVAASDRDARQAEIQQRLNELTSERERLVKDVPADALARYTRLLHTREDAAMAPVEIVDVKRHEYTCGACMMSVPMEVSISLLRGHLTTCASCQCILYLTPEGAQSLTPASTKR